MLDLEKDVDENADPNMQSAANLFNNDRKPTAKTRATSNFGRKSTAGMMRGGE